MSLVKLRRKADDLPLAVLADAVEAKVGHPVSLILTKAADGSAVVDVRPITGDVEVEIEDAELEALAAAAVAAPEPVVEDRAVSVLDALATALTGAKTVADVRTAVLTYAKAERSRLAAVQPATRPVVLPGSVPPADRSAK